MKTKEDVRAYFQDNAFLTTCLWLSRPMALAHLPTTAERLAPGSGPRDNASRSLDNGNRPAPLLPAGRPASATILTEKFCRPSCFRANHSSNMQQRGWSEGARRCAYIGAATRDRFPTVASTLEIQCLSPSHLYACALHHPVGPLRAGWSGAGSHHLRVSAAASPRYTLLRGGADPRTASHQRCAHKTTRHHGSSWEKGCGPEDRQPPSVRS